MTTAYSTEFRQYRQYRTVPPVLYGASHGQMRLQDHSIQASLLVSSVSNFSAPPDRHILLAHTCLPVGRSGMLVCRVDIFLVSS